MKQRIRFIHTADLHLGSPLKSIGQVSGRIAECLKEATFIALQRICDAALRYEANFLVISGDLYDRESRSVKANHFLAENLLRLKEKNIPVYVIGGNHDPLGERRDLLRLPDNVKVFAGERPEVAEFYSRQGELLARIIGRSYRGRSESQRIFESYRPPDTEAWNIGLLHTALDPGNTNYVPCSARELAQIAGIDYWALGHTHSPQLIRKKEPVIAYPGVPQGRAPDELGTGGCLLVELAPGDEPDVSFIPVSPVVWRLEEVRIDRDPGSVPGNLDELEELIASRGDEVLRLPAAGFPSGLLKTAGDSETENLISGLVVRWVVTGRGDLHRHLAGREDEAREVLAARLRQKFNQARQPFLWTESVVLRTGRPIPDLSVLKAEDGIFRDLEAVVKEIFAQEETYRLALKTVGEIWELAEGEDYNPEKMQLKGDKGLETLGEMLAEAKELVIEKIMERREET